MKVAAALFFLWVGHGSDWMALESFESLPACESALRPLMLYQNQNYDFRRPIYSFCSKTVPAPMKE